MSHNHTDCMCPSPTSHPSHPSICLFPVLALKQHHIPHPTSIAYLENCGLKEVLDEAPEETLPLFHFYAMAEIRQKSRINYKQAVRIWKKMKSAAKKCGKTNFWSEYIFTIRDQHRRLRALQEELEKGNLLV